MEIITEKFNSFADQQPGTSGLRKPVKHYQQEHYTQSFIQAIFSTLGTEGKTIAVGGDGRYHNDVAINYLIKIAAANGVKKLIIGENGLLSTPAASHVIRHYKTDYGIILSASHNPAGEDGDFGIKFNLDAGQPAPESSTNAVFETSKKLTEYKIAKVDLPDLSKVGTYKIGEMELEIISSTKDYADLMETLFDFPKIKALLAKTPFVFDAMHAATGPYAIEVFANRLGLDPKYLINTKPLADFGGGHPDPQPSYAGDLIAAMKAHPEALMGAASDGDGDRNMIMGRKEIVSPCDSLAILADQHDIIPCLKKLTGVGRTMPTSRATDAVCKAKNLDYFETPTGWKFFGNLLNADKIQLCGEESFGTSGNHIREKDGIWAVLCWLSLMAETGKDPDQILADHWKKYGRHHFNRFDYEDLDKAAANQVIADFTALMASKVGEEIEGMKVSYSGQFNYKDPTNGEESPNQGLQIQFGDKARIMCRLSGTGTRGATMRMYCEYWQEQNEAEPKITTKGLNALAQDLMGIAAKLGKSQADNIA